MAPHSSASIATRILRDRFEALDVVIGRERGAAVRRALGNAYCERVIRCADDRLPIDVELDLVEAVEGVLGRAGMRRWAHDHATQGARRGMLGVIVNNAIRLFGVSPDGMFRAAGRAWSKVYGGMGRLVPDVRPGEEGPLVLRWVDAPGWVVGDDAYRAFMEGRIEACLSLVQRAGEVRLEGTGPDLRFLTSSVSVRRAS